MAICGSFSLWCSIGVLAAVSGIGMSQLNGGSQLTQSPDNCTAYSANNHCHFPELDQIIYCLTNGSIVTGFCKAQEAVCGKLVPLQKDTTLCSSNSKESSTTTSKTSTTGSTTGSSTMGSKFNQHSHTDDHHDHTGEHHDHDHDQHHDDDNAAPLLHAPGHVILCGFAVVAFASRLFSLL